MLNALANSPLQLFDEVLENAKEDTHEALQTKEPGHFFGSVQSEWNEKMMPGLIGDAINNASIAIELIHRNSPEKNEATAACESYVKALAMNEAEIKLKQIGKLANEKLDRQTTEECAEAAAISGAISDIGLDQQDPKCKKTISFDITDLSYDISYLPNDDPDVYKPLEIISYIGMTQNIE